MELDNRMVINGGSHGPDWNADEREICCKCGEEKPTADCGLAGQICEECLTQQQIERWTEELKAARVGDVVVAVDSQGFRHVLLVRQNNMTLAKHAHLCGDGLLVHANGEVFNISLNSGTFGVSSLPDTKDLQVVSF